MYFKYNKRLALILSVSSLLMLPEGFSMESHDEQRQYSYQGNNTIPKPQDQEEVHLTENQKTIDEFEEVHLRGYLENQKGQSVEEYLKNKLEEINKLPTMQEKKNFLANLERDTEESLFEETKKQFTYEIGYEIFGRMRNKFFDPKNKDSEIVQAYECIKNYLDPKAAIEFVGWLPSILCESKESERGIDIFKLIESSIDTNTFTTCMLHPLAELISDPKKRSIAQTTLYPEIKNKISVDEFKAGISPFTQDHATSYTEEQKAYLTPKSLDDFFNIG